MLGENKWKTLVLPILIKEADFLEIFLYCSLCLFNTTLIFFYLQIESKQLENNLLVSRLSLLRIKLWLLYYFYKWLSCYTSTPFNPTTWLFIYYQVSMLVSIQMSMYSPDRHIGTRFFCFRYDIIVFPVFFHLLPYIIFLH